MSVVHLIDTVTKWAQINICDKIKLKQPPGEQNAPDDFRYKYKLVTPAAFSMYVPTADKNPPKFQPPTPSVCVQFVAGQDELSSAGGFVDIQLCFATWDPGTHGKDALQPNGEGGYKPSTDGRFEKNGDGWRDAWNFVDIALQEIGRSINIGEYTIDRNTPVKYGPLTEQEAIADFYPFWFAWIGFRLNYSLMRNIEDLQEFL